MKLEVKDNADTGRTWTVSMTEKEMMEFFGEVGSQLAKECQISAVMFSLMMTTSKVARETVLHKAATEGNTLHKLWGMVGTERERIGQSKAKCDVDAEKEKAVSFLLELLGPNDLKD